MEEISPIHELRAIPDEVPWDIKELRELVGHACGRARYSMPLAENFVLVVVDDPIRGVQNVQC